MSNPARHLPRRGYAHCFIEEDGIHSRLHLHHFYSLFLPDLAEPVDAHIRVFGADGATLGNVTRRLTPFSSLTLPMSDVLSELDKVARLGTVAVDFEPGIGYERRLIELGPQSAIAQSPFWMGYYDAGGSVAYVHSIDQYFGAVFGIGRIAGLPYRARWHRGDSWASKRLIDAQALRRADAYLVNHSTAAGRATVRWVAHPAGAVVSGRTATIQPHGVTCISVTAEDLTRAGGPVERLRLETDGLLTRNGKPYVMVRYGDGPFSVHHA
ncbi:MAG: hypothetical protein ACRDNK_19570 [Solirubrobacteraceae bacterium]